MFGDAWNKVKNQGAKAKLQAEIKLLDLETHKRKQQFGVDLYELLAQQAKLAPAFLSKLQAQIKEPYEQARTDISKLLVDKAQLQEDIDRIQCNADRARPAFTAKGHLIKAGQTVKDTGIEAKLQAQIVLLDRNIKMRKETFGLDVMALLDASPKLAKNNLLGNVAAKLSSREQDIQKCIEKAQQDVRSWSIMPRIFVPNASLLTALSRSLFLFRQSSQVVLIAKKKEHKEREIVARNSGTL
jgi:hypothetical protein